jgi:hypothetical protein
MLSKIWILLERLAGLNLSLPKSPSTFISTHSWHTSGILHCIFANVLIDTCVALCRQSEETLCNILSLNYRENQQRRNNIALHWNCFYMAWHANIPWALFRWFATASDPDWSQMTSTGLMLPFWSHFELISSSIPLISKCQTHSPQWVSRLHDHLYAPKCASWQPITKH